MPITYFNTCDILGVKSERFSFKLLRIRRTGSFILIQHSATPGRQLVIITAVALVLAWAMIAIDLFIETRHVDAGVLVITPDTHRDGISLWKVLLFGLAGLLTYLVMLAYRQSQLARWQAESKLALQRLIVDQTSEAMLVTDAAQRILSVNAAFERITGFQAAEVLGKTPTRLSCEQPGLAMHRAIWDQAAAVGYWEGEVPDRRKDGSLYPKRLKITAICEDGQNISHFVGVFSDNSDATALAERFDFLTHHDALTKLPNRLALDRHLSATLGSLVPGIHRLALLVIDLDNFKTINDSLGHHAGDRLLAAVAARMAPLMERGGQLFRLGGDEFAVVVEGMEHEAAVSALVGRLIEAIRAPNDIDGRELHVTASIGVSFFPEHGLDGQSLIRNADAAMYEAKAAGRHACRLYDDSMNLAATRRLQLESDLWRALTDGQMVLHYQPQFDLLSGKLVGVEALVRWQHPVRGLIPPAEFIPVAEACGLILPLGHWVLRSACHQLRMWRDAGFETGEMAVNISAFQFRQPEFARSVASILVEAGIPAASLELEITESTIMHGVDESLGTLAELKAMGVKLAIDDFGTGYSSLAYLRRFPFDRLKIDRSFIADVENDDDAAALLTSIVMLGRSLGLQIVAEGVENDAQADFLRILECERVQGFHFHQPQSAEQIVRAGTLTSRALVHA